MHRFTAWLTATLLVLGSLVLIGIGTSAAAYAKDRDCGDFPNQAAAQHYFIDLGGPSYDPDDLDEDGDGVACESNPCPCTTSTTGGGGGGPATPPAPVHHPKPFHKLSARAVEVRHTDRFVAVGRSVTFPNGRLSILRKVVGGGYRAYKNAGTNRLGKFRVGIAAVGSKRSCFMVVVPETKKYRRTTKQIGCITTQ
jgi:hypothetical protein